MRVTPDNIQDVNLSTQTGPQTMFTALRNSNPRQWLQPEKTIEALTQWWMRQPPYDPDWDAISLMQRTDLSHVEFQIYACAGINRAMPKALVPPPCNDSTMKRWIDTSSEEIKLIQLVINNPTANEAQWWSQCFYDNSQGDRLNNEWTEQKIKHCAPQHHFIKIADGLQMSIQEILQIQKQHPTTNSLTLPDYIAPHS